MPRPANAGKPVRETASGPVDPHWEAVRNIRFTRTPELISRQKEAYRRDRVYRWTAVGRGKVTHPAYGPVIVPHTSNFAAIMCAAEVWGVHWFDVLHATVTMPTREEMAQCAPVPDFVRADMTPDRKAEVQREIREVQGKEYPEVSRK